MDGTGESSARRRTLLGDAERDRFVAALRELGVCTATGVFQAHMQVELVNDGPVTILLDTARDR